MSPPIFSAVWHYFTEALCFDSDISREQAVGATLEEVINIPFCPLQEKFHTFVLRGLRNISEAP